MGVPPAFADAHRERRHGCLLRNSCTLPDTARVSSKHGFGTAEAALNEEGLSLGLK